MIEINDDLLISAVEFATEKHLYQVDKFNCKYIDHPLRVMSMMGTVKLKIIAVLHDVVEDCHDVSIGDIELRFGKEIAKRVDLLTRKGETYAERIDMIANSDIETITVKVGDLLDHLRPESDTISTSLKDRYVKALDILQSKICICNLRRSIKCWNFLH